MKKWYNVSINGHVDFPGEDVLIDAPTAGTFNWRDWENDIQGIEFDLPSELFEKPYFEDDFEIEISRQTDVIIKKGVKVDFPISEVDAGKIRLYVMELEVGEEPYLWLKHIRLVVESDPVGTVGQDDWTVSVQLASELVGSKDEHETFRICYDEDPTEQKYTLSKRAKTYVGAKVRVWEPDSSQDYGHRLKFAGRLSEEPSLVTVGVFHFEAKDETEWIDTKVPTKLDAFLVHSIFSYLNPQWSITSSGSYKVETCLWLGEFFELTNCNSMFGSVRKYSGSYFTGDGRFDTFKDAWDSYLKLSKQFLRMTQKYGSNAPEPEWQLVQLDDSISSSGEIDLISLLTIGEFIDVKLSPASSASRLVYQGDTYNTKTTKKTIRGELNTFSLEFDDDFVARNYSADLVPEDWGVSYAEFFDSIYQIITIPSETTILPDDIQVGNYYTIDADSLEMISVFIDSSISNLVFCVSRSDNEFIFWHVKDITT